MLGEFKRDFTQFIKAVLCVDLAAFVVLCLMGQFNTPLVLGFVVGIALVAVDFYLIIVHSMGAVQTEEKAKGKAVYGFLLRYVLVGVVLAICFMNANVNEWVVVAHMFYPKIILTLQSIFRKEA